MTKPALGVITEAAAKAINPAFVAAVNKADGKPWNIKCKGAVHVDPFDQKKGDTFLVFDYAPNRKDDEPRCYMVVKITALDMMREAVRVSNGEYTWRCTPTGVKL